MFLLALLLIITEELPDVWFDNDHRRSMAALFLFAHKCLMATSAYWNTLPGAIKACSMPSQQAGGLSLSTLSFVASLQHWKLEWLPKSPADLPAGQSQKLGDKNRRQEEGSLAGNRGSSIEPASSSQARGRSLPTDGGNLGKQEDKEGMTLSQPRREGSKQDRLPAQNAELPGNDSVHSSPGDSLGMSRTEVSHNLCIFCLCLPRGIRWCCLHPTPYVRGAKIRPAELHLFHKLDLSVNCEFHCPKDR